MPSKKLLGAVAMGAALTGGGVAGVFLGVPTTSGAQVAEESPTTTIDGGTSSDDAADDGATTEAPDEVRRVWHRLGGVDLEAAATALALSEDDLRTKLQDGQTLAEVAQEQGVDVQVVIDALVAAATQRIDEEAAERKADLPDRITDLVNGELPDGFGFGFGFDRGPIRSFVIAGSEAAAEALGLSEDDLRAKLRDGQTLAEVAEEQGVDVQVVIDALVAEATAKLDEAVADGDLTQEQADDRKADLTERITDLVNGELPPLPDGPRFGGPGGHRWGRGAGAPEDSTDDGSSDSGTSAEEEAVTTS